MPTRRSPDAFAKTQTKRTESNDPVHSFGTLLADLATVTANKVQPIARGLPSFRVVSTPTASFSGHCPRPLLGISHRLGCA